MLYIVTELATTLSSGTRKRELVWHVGEEPHKISESEKVLLVQADCDELSHIQQSFSGIPLSDKRVNVWNGEFADFIARNLPR